LKLVDCCALKDVAVDGGVTVVVELISESDVCSAENTRDFKIVRGWITIKFLPLVDDVDVLDDSLDVVMLGVEDSVDFVSWVLRWSQKGRVSNKSVIWNKE
jgi:hypothetical protein